MIIFLYGAYAEDPRPLSAKQFKLGGSPSRTSIWGLSDNGSTVGLHPTSKGSIPLVSTIYEA